MDTQKRRKAVERLVIDLYDDDSAEATFYHLRDGEQEQVSSTSLDHTARGEIFRALGPGIIGYWSYERLLLHLTTMVKESALMVCQSCGEALDSIDPDWRFTGKHWEHKCSSDDYQAGYNRAVPRKGSNSPN